METSVKQRLIVFIKSKKLSYRAFSAEIGASNSFVNNISKGIGADKYDKISKRFPELNMDWLLSGEGEMINQQVPQQTPQDMIPRISLKAAAGALTGFAECVKAEDCELLPVVRSFPKYDYTIIIAGESMYPDFHSGDELAIRQVYDFIEWGKVYVLDTSEGAIVKKIYDGGECFLCRSVNESFPEFSVPKKNVYGVYKVVGLLRL